MKKSARILRVAAIILACLAALIALALIAFCLWNQAPTVSSEGPIIQTTPSGEAPGVSPSPSAGPVGPSPSAGTDPAKETATPQPSPEETKGVVRREGTYVILVAGRDRVGLNTDTLMVVLMDTEGGYINVVSIPRDTLVNVPWPVKKINSIYGTYGIEGLVDGVENLTGIPIDSYVVVNTSIFQQVIDSMGGVWFDVPMYMNYDDPWQSLSIHLAPGYQLLDGYQAEGLVRFRQNNDGSGYADGDLQRIETQHAFLKAAAEQLLSIGNLSNLPGMIELVINNTDTNLTSGNIAFYAQEFFKMDGGAIRFYTMPCEKVNIRGGSYVSVLPIPWLEVINAYLNPFNVEVTPDNLDLLTYDGAGLSSTTGRVPGMDSFFDYYSLAG